MKYATRPTSGSLGTLYSNTTNARSPINPRTNGISTCMETQGNLIPPHVRPITHATVLVTIIALPLNSKGVNQFTKTHNVDSFTYAQSSRPSFCLHVPSGVGRFKKMSAISAEKAHIGRFKSARMIRRLYFISCV